MHKRSITCLAVVVGSLILPLDTALAAGGSSGTTGLATGDFDGDGHHDLAVGVPGEDLGPEGSEIVDAGQVQVIYGSNSGLRGAGNQTWHQDRPGIPDESETDEQFGAAVAAGDLNGDGYDDLAIGAPGEDLGGSVHILFGGPDGLSSSGDERWHQDTPGIKQTSEAGDAFGHSLAVGDFGRSGDDDLAIGVPAEDLGNPARSEVGVVHALYGSNRGLTARGDQVWHQDVEGVEGAARANEKFGHSLAAANFGRSSKDELAIGVPQDSSGEVNSVPNAGAVNVLYGRAGGLRARGDQRWTQDSPNIANHAEDDDSFGWSLTAANLGRKRFKDLAIGAQYEDAGPEGSEVTNAGSVSVIYGARRGLKSRGDAYFTAASPGIAGELQEYSNFGNTLTAANFGKTSVADLAIGTVWENLSATTDAGRVHVIYGRKRGLKARGSQAWTQASPGVSDSPDIDDRFGGSMAAGDFGRSGQADLAIGASGEDDLAGAVHVLYGKDTGLESADEQFWQQGLGPLDGAAESGDLFGGGRYS